MLLYYKKRTRYMGIMLLKQRNYARTEPPLIVPD